MPDVTRILEQIQQGDLCASEQLLPLVYDELRKLAAARLAQEKPGQTLEATALVHEAYLRLVKPCENDVSLPAHWNTRGHFFAAAAEAMRRILIENARRKKRLKRGGNCHQVSLDDPRLSYVSHAEQILAINDALEKLTSEDPLAAQLVKLRYFGGLSVEDAAEVSGIPRSTAYGHWAYARASLRCHFSAAEEPHSD